MNKKIWYGRITLLENVVDSEYIIDIVRVWGTIEVFADIDIANIYPRVPTLTYFYIQEEEDKIIWGILV